jgi:hypothetical protein
MATEDGEASLPRRVRQRYPELLGPNIIGWAAYAESTNVASQTCQICEAEGVPVRKMDAQTIDPLSMNQEV